MEPFFGVPNKSMDRLQYARNSHPRYPHLSFTFLTKCCSSLTSPSLPQIPPIPAPQPGLSAPLTRVLLSVPYSRLRSFGNCTFSFATTTLWNYFPQMNVMPSLWTFTDPLSKTHLFKIAAIITYNPPIAPSVVILFSSSCFII